MTGSNARIDSGVARVFLAAIMAAMVLAASLASGLDEALRWGIGILACGLLAVLLWQRRGGIVLDTFVVAVVAFAVFAVVWAVISPPKESAVEAPSVAVALPLDEIAPRQEELKSESDVVLVVVTTEAENDNAVKYDATRYKAKLQADLATDAQDGSVMVEIERGEKDANLTAFLRDLEKTEKIYVYKTA